MIAPVSFPVRGKLLLRPPLMLVKGSAAMESLWGAGVAQSASQSLLLDLSLKSRHNPSKTGNVTATRRKRRERPFLVGFLFVGLLIVMTPQ